MTAPAQSATNSARFGISSPTLQIGSGKTTRFVCITLIVRIEGYGNYSLIHTRNGEQYLIAKTLSTVSALLPDFWRVHKSWLVNPDYVLGGVGTVRSKAVLRLSTSETVIVARRHKKEVCRRLRDDIA